MVLCHGWEWAFAVTRFSKLWLEECGRLWDFDNKAVGHCKKDLRQRLGEQCGM